MGLTGGKRKLSKWNKFVQKVYADQHRKNKNFQFKDALKMASAMKKKGQYGGEGDEIEEVEETFDASMPDGSVMEEEMGEMGEMEGGRRRRRTMRRRHGSRRRRTMRRGRSGSRRRSRSMKGGVVLA